MKVNHTQKLFWKKWPFKAIIRIENGRTYTGSYYTRKNSFERLEEFGRVKRWCLKKFPEAGVRCETNLSIFLSTEEELNALIDHYGHKVLAVWKPQSESAKDLLVGHEFDVVRDRLWYGKYPIRARIPFDRHFTEKGVEVIQSALPSLTEWHCAGALFDMLVKENKKNRYGWGQPLYLYLSDADDAAMLRLMCGDYIERFERVRNPN